VSETTAPAPAENGAQPQGQPAADPWTQALEGVDEVYRPHVEQTINPLREQFGPRLELADRLEPLGDYADDLLALHGMADDEGNALQDFLGFASMASQVDPENPDSEANQAFQEWFFQIGEQMGWIDPEDGEAEEDGEEFADEDGQGANPEVEELRGIIQQLEQRVEQAESQPRVQAIQQEINGLVENAVREHRLGGEDKEGQERAGKAILRFARDYQDTAESNQQMIDLAVKDLLTLTGGAQRELLNGRDTEAVAAGASPGNGSPDLSPEDLLTGNPEESKRRARRAAESRLSRG
jgi:hypothetical protein